MQVMSTLLKHALIYAFCNQSVLHLNAIFRSLPLLQEVANWIRQEGWPVGELWSVITEYGQKRHYNVNLFDWILPQPRTDLGSRRARK